jgi:Aspartyl protease
VNPLTVGGQRPRYVGYMPVKFDASEDVWWALVDTGAQVSVISAGLASYLDLYCQDMSNVFPASFAVKGYNEASTYMPVLETRLRVGAHGNEERWMPVHLCVLDTNMYKLIIGVDILHELKFVFDEPARRLHLERNGV